jgi:signal transduction histidine kinase
LDEAGYEAVMGLKVRGLSGAIFLAALPGSALAADGGPGAPIAAGLAAVAGISIALAAWMLARRQVATSRHIAAMDADLRRLTTVLQAAPDAYYIWPSADDEICSPRLAGWLGTTVEDITQFSQLAPYFDADQFAALGAAATRLRATDVRFSATLSTVDGDRTFEVRGEAASGTDSGEPAHVVWLRDVTEQLAEAAQVAATANETSVERDRFKEILDAAPMPIWRRGDDLSLEWCNAAYAAAVEADRDSAVAESGIELASSHAAEQARNLAESAQRDGVPQREIRKVVMGGERRAIEVIEVPLGEGRGLSGFTRDVTDLAEADAELKRYINAHEDVLENLPTPVAIFGADKRLKLFNSAFAKLWRLDESWLSEMPSHGEILEALREKRRLPEQADFPAYKKSRLDLYTSLIEPREDVYYLPDGTTLRLRVSPHPLGGLLFLCEDITDRLELERARNTLAAVQQATLEKLYEGVAVFGADGRLKLFNPGFARIWHLPLELLADEPHVSEIVDAGRAMFDTADDWETLKSRLIARAVERTTRQGRLERPDGSVIDYAGVPLPDGNMLFTYLDVTDTARIERALRERNEALETADRLKTEFIANVSYELRTPLNTIIGFSDILSNAHFGNLNERQKEYADGILQSSYHLLDLINDILDLATIEAGRMSLDLKTFDLYEALSGVLPLTREQAFNQDLNVEIDCPTNIGSIEADERRLRQVVFNLVSNAMKFTSSGGTIRVGARRDAENVELWVADTGAGIRPEEHEQVFDKFHKGEVEGGRMPGAGLGLSLVKSFIELHGGEVELDSQEGVGTRVLCRFPAHSAAEPKAAAAGGD